MFGMSHLDYYNKHDKWTVHPLKYKIVLKLLGHARELE